MGSDNVTQKMFGNKKRYQHDITLLERAKILEKYFVDSCTFTNPLAKNIFDYPVECPLIQFDSGSSIGSPSIPENYESPQNSSGTFLVKSIQSIYPQFSTGDGDTADILIYKDDIFLTGWTTISDVQQDHIIELSEGKYGIRYTYRSNDPFNYYINKVEFQFISTSEEDVPDDITITDVVNRLLAITETQRYGETPRFTFNSEQATEYAEVKAPEFAFTKMNLFEALKQVGSYIHAIPELNDNEISFKKLGQKEYATLPSRSVGYTASQSVEQFCSEIDTNVDNLVNLDDEQVGSIIEPYIDGLKTVRTDINSNVNITESNCYIETVYPIEKIIKVEFGLLSDNTYVKDITGYIYESSEYKALSSYDGVYPNAKAFALYYTQGSKNIYGLNFEEEHSISSFFKKPAIINIINAKTKGDYSSEAFIKMQFRVTYIPVVSARVKQRKSNLNATSKKAVLAYNQGANKVDTDFYGENLKGVAERLGNPEKVYTYICKKTDAVPEVGQLFNDEYYISVVKEEEFFDYKKYSLGLSKDFNRWNEYVGIDNNQRFYEISEKQAIERYVNYEDYLVISDDFDIETNEYEKSIATNLISVLRQNFIPSGSSYNQVSFIQAITRTSDLDIINGVTLPATSFAFGNSAYYGCSFSNNYGAGSYVASFIGTDKGIQQEAKYSTLYGFAEYIELLGGSFKYIPQSSYSSAVATGAAIPNIYNEDGSSSFNLFDTTASYPIRLKKDSREKINIAYQIHCVTDKDNVIVGSGLSKKLGVRKGYIDEASLKGEYVDIYVMPREIGKFEKEIIDLPSSNKRISYTMTSDSTNKQLNFGEITLNASGKSIVLVDRQSKELIFAINEDVTNGQLYL